MSVDILKVELKKFDQIKYQNQKQKKQETEMKINQNLVGDRKFLEKIISP